MTEPGRLPSAEPDVRLVARASGQGTIYQAGRDQIITVRNYVQYGPTTSGLRPADPETGSDDCPFPGMESFGVDQTRWFFGRAELTHRLVSSLDARQAVGGALALVAASGAGKSSLLKAGLLPALAEGAIEGSRHWPYLLFTPTADPVGELTAHLATLAGVERAAVADTLADGGSAVESLLREALDTSAGHRGMGGVRLVIVVDQLEELFTLCTDERNRQSFLDVLTGLAASGATGVGPLALVVYAIRADFYPQCMNYPQLRAALQQEQILVGPMSSAQLREAVLSPAAVAGLEVEPGLMELLLRDLGGVADGTPAPGADPDGSTGGYDAGRLPLLAHALRATWLQREGNVLTVQGYVTTGGIHDAVATTAETLFAGLGPLGQEAARTMFLRLVRISEDSNDARRRLSRVELLRGWPDPRPVTHLLDVFTQRRLLTQTRDTVEITHEVLIRAWPRLQRWIAGERAEDLVRQRLEESAIGWDRDHHDTNALYRGNRLEAARTWATSQQHQAQLSPKAALFLAESTRHEHRVNWRRRAAMVGLSVLAVLATLGATVAVWQSRTAGQQRTQAQQQRQIAEEERVTAQDQRRAATWRALLAEAQSLRSTDPRTSLKLSLAALRLNPTPEVRADLDTTLTQTYYDGGTQSPGPIGDIATAIFSRDGRRLVTSKLHGAGTDLWDTTDPARPAVIAHLTSGPTERGAFSTDGRLLVLVTGGGGVLWELADIGKPREVARLPSTGVHAVAIAPDGRTLASTSAKDATDEADTLTLWDVSGAQPRRLSDTQVDLGTDGLRFSPDGRILVAATGTVVARQENPIAGITQSTGWTLFDVADRAHPARGVRVRRYSPTLEFSPDGRLLAVAYDRVVNLWSVTPLRHLATLKGHTDMVWALAFSPDSRTLAAGEEDSKTAIWQLSNPTRPVRSATLSGPGGAVWAVAFSSASTVITAGMDGAISRWRAQGNPQPAAMATLTAHTNSVETAVFTADGRTLATGSFDQTVKLWDTSDLSHPRLLATIADHTGPVETVAFSSDGKMLATGSQDGQAMLWNISDRAHPHRLAALGGQGALWSVAFSPRMPVVITSAGNLWESGSAVLWDISDARRPTRVGGITMGALGSGPAVLSPNGTLLAHTTGLWDTSNPTRWAQISKVGFSVAAFSPDGAAIVNASHEEMTFWDSSDPIHPKQLGTTRSIASNDLDFHPGGNLLAAAGVNGTVQLWDAGDRAQPVRAATLQQQADEINSAAFSPDGRAIVTAGRDGNVVIWNLGDLPAVLDDPVGKACTIVQPGLTPQEWETHLPGIPHEDLCR